MTYAMGLKIIWGGDNMMILTFWYFITKQLLT